MRSYDEDRIEKTRRRMDLELNLLVNAFMLKMKMEHGQEIPFDDLWEILVETSKERDYRTSFEQLKQMLRERGHWHDC